MKHPGETGPLSGAIADWLSAMPVEEVDRRIAELEQELEALRSVRRRLRREAVAAASFGRSQRDEEARRLRTEARWKERLKRDEKIRSLRAAGLTYRVIAERVGVSLTTVCRAVEPDVARREREVSRGWKEHNRELNRARDRERVRRLRGKVSPEPALRAPGEMPYDRFLREMTERAGADSGTPR